MKKYTKSFVYDGMNVANGSATISTGLSFSTIKDIWFDDSLSFAMTNADIMATPLNYISVSEYYRLATSLIDLTTSNIRIDIKWNANLRLNRTVITLKYTKK